MKPETNLTSWTISGAADEPIIGNTHHPSVDPRGVLIVAHGFKGYKDYGMFPTLAEYAAARGLITHRFNFSHSGMTNNIDTFEKPELFERDTWNKQVFDLRQVVQAVASGELAGSGLPYAMLGHSRGGVSVLLTTGRLADVEDPPRQDESLPQPAGVITIAAPDRCNTLSAGEQQTLLDQGFLESPSNRTGQTLRIDRAYLQEQLDEPDNHDLLALVRRIRCPLLVVHGEDDPTVPASSADRIAEAASGPVTKCLIPGGDHVMNTPNPMPPDAEPSPQLAALLNAVIDFAASVGLLGNRDC